MHRIDDPRRIRPARRCAVGLLAALALTGAARPAFAQAAGYPTRPIRLLVGYPAGGGVDAVARLLAPRLSASLGQPVVVDNRTGASGLIAADAVAKAAPDGYTLLVGETSMLVAPLLQPRLAFDPLKSFAPVAALFKLPLLLVASNDFPARNPQEFLALVKSQPGRYAYGSPGIGTVQHLAFEMLKGRTGAFVVHIPYRGAAQIIPDVISGQTPLGVLTAASTLPQIKAGRLRALAVMSQDKLAGADGIPALAEVVPGFDAAPRIYLLAPAQTPAAVIERLAEATRAAMDSADVAAAAAQQGAVPAFLPPGPFGASLAEESKRWEAVIRQQKISVE